MLKAVATVPMLDALLKAPEQVTDLPAPVARDFLIQLASLLPLLATQAGTPSQPVSDHEPGRYLTVAEVVAEFKVSELWLYRHKKQLPHSQPSRKVLLFPEEKLRRWFANRKQA